MIFLVHAGCAHAQPVNRHVLALYDSAQEPTPKDTLIHTFADMPLNHMGYVVDYHDLKTGLPTDEDLEGKVAILTMFRGQISSPSAYYRWLARKADKLPRMIILGVIGGDLNNANRRLIQPVFERMGLHLTGDYVIHTRQSSIVAEDPDLIGFEARPDPVPPQHAIVTAKGSQARIGLRYSITELGKRYDSVVVATGPGGGYVASGFYSYYDPALNLARWVINPFEFFRRALDHPAFPIPDTTTVSGRRLYFSEVDGDGWNSVTRIERYRNQNVSVAEAMISELIEPYPDLPISVALVLSDMDPRYGARPDSVALAKRAFALPQVEVASHTHTHPFEWQFFERYNRDRELALVDRGAARKPAGVFQRLGAMFGLTSGRNAGKYIASNHDLPRAYSKEPFDLDREIGEALRKTEALAPPGKKIKLYQWSGNAQPFEAAIRATRQAGVRNINGGDTRFDRQNPSIIYISPLSRVVGAERQIYAVNTNENNYTMLWTDRFHGFSQARETFKRTESPIRLRGIDVYYHTYSAERAASLDAVRSHLDWVRTQKVTPIHASDYAAIADGFFSTRMEQTGPLRWTVSERDGLNTVRFDDADDLALDMEASEGVLGSLHYQGSLYVALDADVATAIVALARKGGTSADGERKADRLETAQLHDSRWVIQGMRRSPCALSFNTTGFGMGEFTWTNVPPSQYDITAKSHLGTTIQVKASADDSGTLAFNLPLDARNQPVDVSVACAAGEAPRS
ncbi:MAG: hypothetical protein KDJ90_00910 [Nitratireductor sp.]|nr:hypothetical protein [Nitratireductor sp.]